MKERHMLVCTLIGEQWSLVNIGAWTHQQLDGPVRMAAWLQSAMPGDEGEWPESLPMPPAEFQPQYFPFETGDPLPGTTRLGRFPAPGIVIVADDTSFEVDLFRLALRADEHVREFLAKDSYVPDLSKYDVFLSYASRDSSLAQRIHSALEAEGLRCFMAERDIFSGDEWAEKIRDALTDSWEMCILCSPSSLGSEWVLTEWGAAWALQKRIVPLLYRVDVGGLPGRLQASQCMDFADLDAYVKQVADRRRVD